MSRNYNIHCKMY